MLKRLLLILTLLPTLSFGNEDVFMSYNVLCNVCNRNPSFFESWANRKSHVFDVINQESPDILGLQEIDISMTQDVSTEFTTEYGIYSGTLSDDTLGSNPGLMNLILYKKSKYNFINGGSFRLSTEPDDTIPPWQDAYKRVCTWGIFETKTEEPVKFKALSCHLPAGNSSQSKVAVEELANVLWSSVDTRLPHFVMGDFNSLSTPITYLSSEEGAEATYDYPSNFRPLIDHLDEFKIDYVFRTSGGYRFSETYKSGTEPYSGDFRPSDHPAILLRGRLIEKSTIVASLITSVYLMLIFDEEEYVEPEN